MGYTVVKGVDKLYYAKVIQDDAFGYVADTPVALAPMKTSVQTPAVNSKTEYYDNQPFLVLMAEGETKIKMDVTRLPLSVQADILGKVYDSTTDSLYDNGSIPPDCALGFRAKNSDGTYTMIWYFKGKFAPFVEEANAETDTPDPKGISLEFTAIRTTYQFALNGSVTDATKRRISTKQADMATWFNHVQVPTNGTPSALTCTPAPADGETGVVASIAPTLTFNNALVTGTAGILLTENDGTIVTCTIAINTANKVVTITPGSNLTSAAKYLITVAGAKDIYGQTLANAVYDFTIA
jgi:phi13 family phage major tail protein